MIGYVFRRILWLVPTLIAITLLSFGLLSSGIADERGGVEAGARFFNPSPRGVHQRATEAAHSIAHGSPDASEGARALSEMGGAALPHVLPRLDALSPQSRTKVALALAPVAKRMGLRPAAEYTHPETAALFWNRYWQDHAIDFRPAVVRRAVRRVAQRPSAVRIAEVEGFDTYALPDLIRAMPPVKTTDDVARVRRLSRLAARLISDGATLPPAATVSDAQRVASAWKSWWLHHRSHYVPFQGASRLVAMLRETDYGRWVGELTSGTFGTNASSWTTSGALLRRAATTAWLVGSGLLAGCTLGLMLAVALALSRRNLGRAVSSALLAVSLIPMVALASVAAPNGARGHGLLGAALMALAHGATVAWHVRGSQPLSRAAFARAPVGLGQARRRVGLTALRSSAVTVLSLAGTEIPFLITWAFVVEQALGLHGLGEPVVAAVRAGDVQWLMALVVASALTVAVLQIAADVALRVVDPRLEGVAAAAREGSV